MIVCFFFKQKTAYEMRISDWSSDVCSSDLKRGENDRPYRGFAQDLPRVLFRACIPNRRLHRERDQLYPAGARWKLERQDQEGTDTVWGRRGQTIFAGRISDDGSDLRRHPGSVASSSNPTRGLLRKHWQTSP